MPLWPDPAVSRTRLFDVPEPLLANA